MFSEVGSRLVAVVPDKMLRPDWTYSRLDSQRTQTEEVVCM